MTELLIEELASVGLKLNSAKTKILHTAFPDDPSDIDFTEAAGDFIRIRHDDHFHRYVGRHLILNAKMRIDMELTHHKQHAW